MFIFSYSDHSRVAVLQGDCVEIHDLHGIEEDGATKILGTLRFPRPDAYPQWRFMAWSPDNQALAVSHSDGQVDLMDAMATRIATIPSVSPHSKSYVHCTWHCG